MGTWALIINCIAAAAAVLGANGPLPPTAHELAADAGWIEVLRWETEVTITLAALDSGPIVYRSTSWLSANALRVETQDDVLLADLDNGKLTLAGPGKTSGPMDVNAWRRAMLNEGGQRFLRETARAYSPTVTGRTEIIAGCPCREFVIAMSGADISIWVTTAAPWSGFVEPMLERMWTVMGPAVLAGDDSLPSIPGFAMRISMTATGWTYQQLVDAATLRRVHPALFTLD